MKNINKSMVIGIVVGIFVVLGIAKCRDVWKARQREKQVEAQMEAMREAERQMIKKLKTLKFKTEM